MKHGGGKQKGSRFERQVAEMIRKVFYCSNEECYRTPLSGGHRYASKADSGDLVLSEALKSKFGFSVECKHYREIHWSEFMTLLPQGRGLVAKWWGQTCNALIRRPQPVFATKDLNPLLVFKQNNGPVMCMFEAGVLQASERVTCLPCIRTDITGTDMRICLFATLLKVLAARKGVR